MYKHDLLCPICHRKLFSLLTVFKCSNFLCGYEIDIEVVEKQFGVKPVKYNEYFIKIYDWFKINWRMLWKNQS